MGVCRVDSHRRSEEQPACQEAIPQGIEGLGGARRAPRVQRRRLQGAAARAAPGRSSGPPGAPIPPGSCGSTLLLFGVLLGFALLGAWRGRRWRAASASPGWIVGYAAAAAVGRLAARGRGRSPRRARSGSACPSPGRFASSRPRRSSPSPSRWRGGAATRSEPARGDRALGAAFGATRGARLALVLVGWLAPLGDALRSEGMLAALPSRRGAPSARAGAARSSRAARARRSGRAIPGRARSPRWRRTRARPSSRCGRCSSIRASSTLQRDADFWHAVEGGDVERRPRAAERPRPRRRRAACAASSRSLGLVDARRRRKPDRLRARARGRPRRGAAARLATLRNDPEVRALLEDPEVLGLVERGDALGLLAHPRFQSVLRRATRVLSASGRGVSQPDAPRSRRAKKRTRRSPRPRSTIRSSCR